MIVVAYQPEHFEALALLQPAQEVFRDAVPPNYAEWLGKVGPAFTVMDGEAVVAVCGLAEEWEGRAQCWALLTPAAGRCMVALTRAVRAYFATTAYRRIEAQTPQDFPEGRRWLGLLGFEDEGPMRNYYPDGRTAIRFARCPP